MTPTVTELMTSKPKHKEAVAATSKSNGTYFPGRMGLGAYLGKPESFPGSRVIYHTPDFVVIHDMFPKATVHTLLLPRSSSHNLLHPFDAFDDREFLEKVRSEAAKLKILAAKELQRQLGSYSKIEAAREAILNGDIEAEGNLPPGRDWIKEILCGIHAVPSMSHLHVHVLSRDMHSDCVTHRKHYNSFQTPFLVDLDDFPLEKNDPRRDTKKAGYLQREFTCWRCGKKFGNQFKKLKDHLGEEFEEWKRE